MPMNLALLQSSKGMILLKLPVFGVECDGMEYNFDKLLGEISGLDSHL